MNREKFIALARKAGGDDWGIFRDFMPEIDRFADLVVEAERERIKWDTIHSCHPECDKPVCVAIRKAVAEEREACAKVCESVALLPDAGPVYCSFAIRARGTR